MTNEETPVHDDPNNWPGKFGFITNPKLMVGKVIAEVTRIEMEYGCTHRCALFLRFSDDSRGFLLASDASQCLPSPTLDSMKKAMAYTPDEVATIVRAAESRRQTREKEYKASKRRELEQLKKELGEA